MPGVARVGDPSDHGGIILPAGAPTSVDTDGRAPAVAGMFHSCPIRGHGITALIPTETTVDINGLMRIRFGDKAGCGATIIAASPDIFIGGPNPIHEPTTYYMDGEFDAAAGIVGDATGGISVGIVAGQLDTLAGIFGATTTISTNWFAIGVSAIGIGAIGRPIGPVSELSGKFDTASAIAARDALRIRSGGQLVGSAAIYGNADIKGRVEFAGIIGGTAGIRARANPRVRIAGKIDTAVRVFGDLKASGPKQYELAGQIDAIAGCSGATTEFFAIGRSPIGRAAIGRLGI